MYNCQDEDSDIGLCQLLHQRQIRNLGCKTLHRNILGIFFFFWWWWGGSYSWELVFLRITIVFRKGQTSFKFVFVLSCTSRFTWLLILSVLEELAYFGLELTQMYLGPVSRRNYTKDQQKSQKMCRELCHSKWLHLDLDANRLPALPL